MICIDMYVTIYIYSICIYIIHGYHDSLVSDDLRSKAIPNGSIACGRIKTRR